MFLEDWLAAVARQAAGKLSGRKSVRAAGNGFSGQPPLARRGIYLAEALEPRVFLSTAPVIFQPQQPQQILPTGADPISVKVADLTGNGIQDLVVANEANDSVSVLLGIGNGTFQAQKTYATGLGTRGLAVADLNGDGKLDLHRRRRTAPAR